MNYTIDAENKILGRIATEVADLLRGKNRPQFDPSQMTGGTVTVYNTDKIRVTGKKATQKLYRHHSGYHGGLKSESFERLLARDSRLTLQRAVLGMLPKNRLRSKFIKNLTLHKGPQK